MGDSAMEKTTPGVRIRFSRRHAVMKNYRRGLLDRARSSQTLSYACVSWNTGYIYEKKERQTRNGRSGSRLTWKAAANLARKSIRRTRRSRQGETKRRRKGSQRIKRTRGRTRKRIKTRTLVLRK